MPWGPHWHHQLTDSSGKTIEIFCSSDNMYLHIVHVSYVRQIMTFCMYSTCIYSLLFQYWQRSLWSYLGNDEFSGARMQVLVSMCSKPMQVRHLDKSTEFQIITDGRIYYMIEMALGPLLLFNMHNISEKEIRGCVCFRTLCISAPVAWRMRNCTDIMPWTSLCTPTSPAPSGDTPMSWYTEHYQLS